MTDALLTAPGPSASTAAPRAYKPRRSHKRAPLQSPPARLLFAENRQREMADTLQSVILRGGVLSLLTLTIYRFWMKTEQRRLIWRETRLDGDGFEYTGTPLELMIGSMIAVVILAVWFGVANLGLSYLHLAAWQNFDLTVFLFPVVISPLVAFALYRARRYKMLRTRWRGIRFGMDGSATRFAGLWILWTLGQGLTLGFITPHKRMALERYMTNHMLYGDARFEFDPPEGALRHLTAHWMLPWLTGVGLTVLGVLAVYAAGGFSAEVLSALDIQAEETGTDPLALKLQSVLGLAVIPALLVYPFYLRYKSREIATTLSSRRLINAQCEAHLTWATTFKPLLSYCGYWLLLTIPVSLALGVVSLAFVSLALLIDGSNLSVLTAEVKPQLFESWASKIAVYASLYSFYGGMVLFSLWLATLIHFRRLHTYICRGTVVHNLISLSGVRQRVRDDQVESEGFADALDVGGF